ncbi:MAG: TraR/DksA family transcriptional regulator [Candidatus Latescibacteria bacterium]|jgi:DnaK suppressor protein|nr:TraR/DksA family transcriptional regulator [Candidatus Latescibacterota bacterium]
MKAKDIERYEKLLLEKRKSLMHELGYFGDKTLNTNVRDVSGSHPYSEHPADQGTEMMEQEQAYSLATREGRFLFHIDEALNRVKDGTYGICAECKEPINSKRLEAVPHARMCIECKSREEDPS